MTGTVADSVAAEPDEKKARAEVVEPEVGYLQLLMKKKQESMEKKITS